MKGSSVPDVICPLCSEVLGLVSSLGLLCAPHCVRFLPHKLLLVRDHLRIIPVIISLIFFFKKLALYHKWKATNQAKSKSLTVKISVGFSAPAGCIGSWETSELGK